MVQEVTTKSWGSRIVGALWGVLIGIACIVGSFMLVFWNEGHSLHTAQSLQQTHDLVLAIDAAPINPNNDLHVVYMGGLATTADVLSDKLFNVSEAAIQLHRQVEMYQWQEEKSTKTEKNYGGSEQEVTTYSYHQIWASDLINSAEFKEQSGHQNPSAMPLKSKTQYAEKVKVGDFNLPAALIKQISGATPVDLSNVDTEALQKKFKKTVHQQGEGLYLGDDENTPKIGDLKIAVNVVLPQTVSIIGQQTGETLQAFMAPAGQEVLLINMGQMSSDQMIHEAEMQNRMMTWIWRGVSLLLMIIGFSLLMQPVVVLADVVPFFGSLVGMGTGLIAFIVGLMCWTVAIAIAWFAVRPVWAVGLLVLAAMVCYFVYSRKKA
jgi:hypothetical protein